MHIEIKMKHKLIFGEKCVYKKWKNDEKTKTKISENDSENENEK